MAKRPAKVAFVPKNPEKYIGPNKGNIIARSSWEISVMNYFDNHPMVSGWSSETISIPYKNPLTGRWSMYVPDFLVIYVDKDNGKHCDLIEVKPEKEHPAYQGKVSSRTKLVQAINAAKWQAALIYCAKRNWTFRVATEKQLFAFKRKS